MTLIGEMLIVGYNKLCYALEWHLIATRRGGQALLQHEITVSFPSQKTKSLTGRIQDVVIPTFSVQQYMNW